MFIETLNIEIKEYKKRIRTFVVYDYTIESIDNIHYNTLCDKISEYEVEEVIYSLWKHNRINKYKSQLKTLFTKPKLKHARNIKVIEKPIVRKESNIKVEEFNSSLSERIVATILELNNISYQFQYKLDDSRRRFDFLVNYKGNIFIIEVNGSQHYTRGNTSRSERMYYTSVESDNYKTDYCIDKGIPLYFIDASKPSFQFILDSFYCYKDLRFLVDGLNKKDLIDYFNMKFEYPY